MSPAPNLFLACYELGHQPMNLAWPLALVRKAGYQADGIDLSVEMFPERKVRAATFIGISVPMHTAMKLGVEVARHIRSLNPLAHICFYGLYAWLNADYLLSTRLGEKHPLADSVIAGEAEEAIVDCVAALTRQHKVKDLPGVYTKTGLADPILTRLILPVPDRTSLQPLDRYARFAHNGERSLAGYTETTRGCLHECTHCPVVPIYHGRLFVIPADVILADIRNQVAMGAGHITFGDPDFLNAPGHVLKITRAMHQEFPRLSYNFTTKVEHILEKPGVIAELKQLGAAFMVSAFESTSDVVLSRLDKGHSVDDLDRAIEIADAAELPIQPTWVPFTPWTKLEDYLDLLEWIESRGLIPAVPAVQLSIRLLVPPKSLLTKDPDAKVWMAELDPAGLTFQWHHQDPRMDELQLGVMKIAEEYGQSNELAFSAIKGLAYHYAEREPTNSEYIHQQRPSPPRLTEDWFC